MLTIEDVEREMRAVFDLDEAVFTATGEYVDTTCKGHVGLQRCNRHKDHHGKCAWVGHVRLMDRGQGMFWYPTRIATWKKNVR